MPRQAYRSGGLRSRPTFKKRYSAPKRGAQKQFIHPSKFVKSARQVESVEYVSTNRFEDFALHPMLHEAVARRNYEAPSAIQDQAIPHGLEGRDVVGIADTGTGKTAAFALPVLNRLLNDRQSKALIMAPTRELAEQIEQEIRAFAKGSGLYGALLIGGTAMGGQIRDLRQRPSIVIGTPGRIKDHMERGNLRLSEYNIIVLDEVDRMVDMGFINDIRLLLGALAPVRQSLFFSATLDAKINALIQAFLSDPITISVKTGDTSENVEQNIVRYQTTADKLDKLHNVLIGDQVKKALIFDETQRDVERLSQDLSRRGFGVDALHGGKTQGQRQRALNRFRSNEISFLVATDVAARGIDIVDITHVINYTTPNTYDDYVHRIGRAGRAGRTGYSLTFIND